MLSWPKRVFLSTAPTDMRKGFPGLAAIVREHLAGDPRSGDLYVFGNRRGDRVKCLYWDHNGYVIVYKQLGQGRFRIPRVDLRDRLEMTPAELALLLDGADVRQIRRPVAPPPKKLRYDRKTLHFAIDNVCTS